MCGRSIHLGGGGGDGESLRGRPVHSLVTGSDSTLLTAKPTVKISSSESSCDVRAGINTLTYYIQIIDSVVPLILIPYI